MSVGDSELVFETAKIDGSGLKGPVRLNASLIRNRHSMQANRNDVVVQSRRARSWFFVRIDSLRMTIAWRAGGLVDPLDRDSANSRQSTLFSLTETSRASLADANGSPPQPSRFGGPGDRYSVLGFYLSRTLRMQFANSIGFRSNH